MSCLSGVSGLAYGRLLSHLENEVAGGAVEGEHWSTQWNPESVHRLLIWEIQHYSHYGLHWKVKQWNLRAFAGAGVAQWLQLWAYVNFPLRPLGAFRNNFRVLLRSRHSSFLGRWKVWREIKAFVFKDKFPELTNEPWMVRKRKVTSSLGGLGRLHGTCEIYVG
jgi:hypothetical protein